MQYEIVNPGDPNIFLAESHEAAALVIFLSGPAYCCHRLAAAIKKKRMEATHEQ